MKRFLLIYALIQCAAIFSAAQDFSGYWSGDIDVNGQSLTIGIDIHGNNGTGYTGLLDVIQQGARGIPAEISVNGFCATVSIPAIKAVFECRFVMNVLTGTFSQAGLRFPLTMSRAQRPEAERTQTPEEPFPYHCEEVSFVNEAEGNLLAGTLTLPESGGPFTAIVLVSGSGTQDRDETIAEHKPFLVIADYLTRMGYATLRYDDRGAGKSEAGSKEPTTMDLSFDAAAAVRYLKGRSEISRIGIAGHSEGGMIAYIAADTADADFIISLAGPCVKGSEVLLAQQKAILRAQGMDEASVKGVSETNRQLFGLIDRYESPDENFMTEAGDILKNAGIGDTMQAENIIGSITGTWMWYFLKSDPQPYIRDTDIPVLALNGSKDLQVIASQNLGALRILAADKPNFTIMELPGLNHLFQECETGLPSEYYSIPQTISPAVLSVITEWLEDIRK